MIELKYKDRVLPNPDEDMDPFNESHLYFGTSETGGSLLVCPALENTSGNSCILNLLLRRNGERLRKIGQAPVRRNDSALAWCRRGLGHRTEHASRCWFWDVEANRYTLRLNVFYRSLLLFLLWMPLFLVVGVIQCDVAVNAWLTGVPGMSPVFVPSISFAAGVPSPVDAIPDCSLQHFTARLCGRGPTSRRPYRRGSPW